MNSVYSKLPTTDERIAYVRPVDVSDLPDEMREQTDGLNEIYAVHDAKGTRLALVLDQKMAFLLARENDYAPVYIQ